MNVAFGTGDEMLPVNRRVTNPVGFSTLNRLNTSPMTSTRARLLPSLNAREARKVVCVKR